MVLNPRQVSAFRAVMLTGSMTGAAEFLHISQPAVSRLIKDFEFHLDLTLFNRRGNQLIPTQEANALFREVERSYVGLSRIAKLAEALKTQTAGSLKIAALPALAASLLPRFTGKFLQGKEHMNVSIMGMPSSVVIEAVASGEADFGYADGPAERHGFLVSQISLSSVVIIPEAHHL